MSEEIEDPRPPAARDGEEVPHHEPVLSRPRAKKLYVIIGGAALVLLLGYGLWVLLTRGKESTDDAQVAADVVPIAARVAGQVVAVHVTENQAVHRGDLVAEIDPRDAQVKLAQSQSDLDTARAQAAQIEANGTVLEASARGGLETARGAVESSREAVDVAAAGVAQAAAAVDHARASAAKAASDWRRAEELGGKGDISRAEMDAARAAHEAAQADVVSAQARLREADNQRQAATAGVAQAHGRLTASAPVAAQIDAARAQGTLARARVRAAEAALQAAQLALSYTRVTAPADGIASRLAVHAGGLVSAGQAIVQLVPARTYVVANFKETQMRGMRPGQRARIRIAALGRQDFEGTVESLSGGTGATFSLLPPDNASGNFVKVVQRVPVRIAWKGPSADRTPVGSSAEVTVYTQ